MGALALVLALAVGWLGLSALVAAIWVRCFVSGPVSRHREIDLSAWHVIAPCDSSMRLLRRAPECLSPTMGPAVVPGRPARPGTTPPEGTG